MIFGILILFSLIFISWFKISFLLKSIWFGSFLSTLFFSFSKYIFFSIILFLSFSLSIIIVSLIFFSFIIVWIILFSSFIFELSLSCLLSIFSFLLLNIFSLELISLLLKALSNIWFCFFSLFIILSLLLFLLFNSNKFSFTSVVICLVVCSFKVSFFPCVGPSIALCLIKTSFFELFSFLLVSFEEVEFPVRKILLFWLFVIYFLDWGIFLVLSTVVYLLSFISFFSIWDFSSFGLFSFSTICSFVLFFSKMLKLLFLFSISFDLRLVLLVITFE